MVWTKENIPQNKTIIGVVSPLSEDEKQYFKELLASGGELARLIGAKKVGELSRLLGGAASDFNSMSEEIFIPLTTKYKAYKDKISGTEPRSTDEDIKEGIERLAKMIISIL